MRYVFLLIGLLAVSAEASAQCAGGRCTVPSYATTGATVLAAPQYAVAPARTVVAPPIPVATPQYVTSVPAPVYYVRAKYKPVKKFRYTSGQCSSCGCR